MFSVPWSWAVAGGVWALGASQHLHNNLTRIAFEPVKTIIIICNAMTKKIL